MFENDLYKVDSQSNSILLKTIKIPKNIMNLSNRLPKKNYTFDKSLINEYEVHNKTDPGAAD